MDRFLSTGQRPDHIDFHYCHTPVQVWAGIQLAKKYNLPMRAGNKDIETLCEKEGVRYAPNHISDFYNQDERHTDVETMLGLLKTNLEEGRSCIEFAVHPAYVDLPLLTLSSYNVQRATELAVLLDPAIMEYIAKKENLDIAGVMNVLNKKSGVLGLSKNLSSDFRDLEEGMNNGNKYAKAAMDVFCYRVAKYIGSYVAAMNGVDAIAFTAGIGENAGTVRKMVVSYLGYLGITLDEEANKKRGEDLVISTADSKVKVAVIPTNEELAIARETVALV